jgi:DNA-binding SARP family transcriptional activator
MGSSLSPEQDALTQIEVADSQGPDAMNWALPDSTLGDAPPSAVISFLERGLNCIRQENYTEGVILFAQARQQLLPDQMQLAAMLDRLMRDCEKYWQAQQALNQASKRFAEIDAELKAHIAILEKIIPTFLQNRDTDTALPALSRSLKNSNDHQMTQSSLSSLEAGTPLQTLASRDESSETLPALYITCFCRFQVMRLGQPLVLCPNRNGQAILRYLVAQPEHRASMDILMTLLWPEDEPAVAHHKLQVAVSALRSSLNHGYVKDAGGGYILCNNRVYELNPLVPLRSDVDEFLEYYEAGRQSSGNVMAAYYNRACELYTGPFLSEDLYADWSFLRRNHLTQVYLTMCTALADHCLETGRYDYAMRWSGAILKENRSDEVAHRHLMRAYAAPGPSQRGLAPVPALCTHPG